MESCQNTTPSFLRSPKYHSVTIPFSRRWNFTAASSHAIQTAALLSSPPPRLAAMRRRRYAGTSGRGSPSGRRRHASPRRAAVAAALCARAPPCRHQRRRRRCGCRRREPAPPSRKRRCLSQRLCPPARMASDCPLEAFLAATRGAIAHLHLPIHIPGSSPKQQQQLEPDCLLHLHVVAANFLHRPLQRRQDADAEGEWEMVTEEPEQKAEAQQPQEPTEEKAVKTADGFATGEGGVDARKVMEMVAWRRRRPSFLQCEGESVKERDGVVFWRTEERGSGILARLYV
ncbi:hypothetical protein ACP4OV_007151 [Aristida adscensionis]